MDGVKNIIAIASGKGGVGKSTVAVNLALALAALGNRVGILDADIYGPSQPTMVGADHEKPQPSSDQKKVQPIVRHGIQTMSMGYFIDSNTAMIWRGPMASTAMQQLFRDTHWDNVDYLIVDLPPGTGDIQLTLAQKIAVTGSIIVTTPQEIALIDARKAYEMFHKVHVPILGIIENMSTHICSHCGHEESIFGSGGGAQLAATLNIPLLGQLPLDKQMREDVDLGTPTVVARPESKITLLYIEMAKKLLEQVSKQKSYTDKFKKIKVEIK